MSLAVAKEAARGLNSQALLTSVVGLARDIRRNESQLLLYLAEVKRRKLYLDQGYPTLSAYCVKELKFSETSAGRYVAASIAASQHTHLFDLLETGSIHMTALGMIASYIKDEATAASRIEQACGKSLSQLKILLANWSEKPVAAVRDSIKPVPVAVGEAEPTSSSKNMLKFSAEAPAMEAAAAPGGLRLNTGGSVTESNCEPAIASNVLAARGVESKAKTSAPAAESELTAKRVVIRFEATGALVEQINRAKEVLSHSESGNSLAALFEEALAALLEKRDPLLKVARKAARLVKREQGKAEEAKTPKKPVNTSPEEFATVITRERAKEFVEDEASAAQT